MKVLFTCGGTAGHINPALAVAGQLKLQDPSCEIMFIGAEGHMETELVPREGYPMQTIRIAGLQRSLKPKIMLGNLKLPFRIAQSVKRSKEIIREFKPDVVVGTGGYVCYPVLKAASSMKIPTLVHESNAAPGLTTKLLEGRVNRIMVGFEECREQYKHPDKVLVTGTPVRVGFAGSDKLSARRELGLPEDRPVVTAVFGSLGAAYLNNCMRDFLQDMKDKATFRLIYATGKSYYPRVKEWMTGEDLSDPNMDVREYIYDMEKVMSASDIVICRAGASTLGELTCLGIPAVIVPSPNVTNHHQEKNAAVLAHAGAARVLLEGEFNGHDLYKEVCNMLADEPGLAKMHEASAALSVPDCARHIADLVCEVAEKGAEK